MNSLLCSFLILGLVGILTFVIFRKTKSHHYKTALVLILIIGFSLRTFVGADKQLHEWDEKYHALVGKNLSKHPLKPTLYDKPVLDYDVNNWIGNHVWLVKPPVALWGIALSVKTFGTNTFAVRLPSLIYGLLGILLTYLIGSLLFDKRIAIFGAYLHAINGSVIELGAGKLSSDHVETAFIFFIELAIFLSVYSSVKKQNYFTTVLIGIITGLAFLTKWYPAGIVFPVWLMCFIFLRKGSLIELIKHGIILLGCTLVVIAPWIYFVKSAYPFVADIALNKFLDAYSSPLENHSAPWYYYLHKVMVLFGELIYGVLAFSIYHVFKKIQWQSILVLLVWIAVPLFIFSFGETKRFTYLLISAPAFFLLTGHFWFILYDSLKDQKKIVLKYVVLLSLIVLPLRLTIERTKLFQPKTVVSNFYNHLPEYQKKLNSNDIVFGSDKNIELMFFTNVGAAYVQLPEENVISELKNKGYNLYYLQDDRLISY